MNGADKVTSILPKIQEKQDYLKHLDMKCDMQRLLGQAIADMRSLGATSKDIATTLQHAAGELLQDEA
jgi:hypothetical protein